MVWFPWLLVWQVIFYIESWVVGVFWVLCYKILILTRAFSFSWLFQLLIQGKHASAESLLVLWVEAQFPNWSPLTSSKGGKKELFTFYLVGLGGVLAPHQAYADTPLAESSVLLLLLTWPQYQWGLGNVSLSMRSPLTACKGEEKEYPLPPGKGRAQATQGVSTGILGEPCDCLMMMKSWCPTWHHTHRAVGTPCNRSIQVDGAPSAPLMTWVGGDT